MNLKLVRGGLVLYSFGQRMIARQSGLVAISQRRAVRRAEIRRSDVNRPGRTIIEGTLCPSSDLVNPSLLYRTFPAIGGVVHTHSQFATAWARLAGRFRLTAPPMRLLLHPVGVIDEATADEVGGDYVLNTGHAILRRFGKSTR